MKRLLSIVAMTIVLGACSTAPTEKPTPQALAESKGYVLGESVAGIQNYDINGWQYVSPYSLIIPSRPGKKYLVTFDNPCRDLQSVEVIGTTSTVNQFRAKFDSVLVRGAGGIRQKCPVAEIYEIKKKPKPKQLST